MGHDHGASGHQHGQSTYGRAFAIGIGLNLLFVLIEFWYSGIAHSVALAADAGHNLSDVLSLALAWAAALLTRTAATRKRTFGLRRSSILAALVNAAVLLVAIGAIAWEAIRRFSEPSQVEGKTVMVVAGIGILINAITALLFWSGRSKDLNIRGAFLHMAADAVVSLGVVIAGFLMLRTGWLWLDPVVSLIIAGVIFVATWGLLRDSINMAMDAVPEGIDQAAVERYLRALPDCRGVHDLHIWGMSTTETALMAHLVVDHAHFDGDRLESICRDLHQQFGVEHSTLQLECSTNAGHCGCSIQA